MLYCICRCYSDGGSLGTQRIPLSEPYRNLTLKEAKEKMKQKSIIKINKSKNSAYFFIAIEEESFFQ